MTPFDPLSTGSLDYWQRTNFSPLPIPAGVPLSAAPPGRRGLIRVHGVGKQSRRPEGQRRFLEGPPLADLLIGLCNYRIPLAFGVYGHGGITRVRLGTWSPPEKPGPPDTEQEVLRSVLSGLFERVELSEESAAENLTAYSHFGFVTGVPSFKLPDPADEALALDKLIRALDGGTWGFLVLAMPAAEQAVTSVRHMVINEARAVETALQASGSRPLAEHYLELLKKALEDLTQGHAVGAWRTGVYLMGDRVGYYRLASAWKALFAGADSLPEPLRVWDAPEAGRFAAQWALPDAQAPAGPATYRHPFMYQALLTSTQLAAYVQLPQKETPGFAIDEFAEFGVVPGGDGPADGIEVGRVQQRSRLTPVVYRTAPEALTRHVFVAGVTGAGKTNTVFHLLGQLAASGVPFLVVEPAKAEYRALASHPRISPSLSVYTLGDEGGRPLRLNPFEVPAGIPVSVHLDLLRSVFAASFGMWTPLPQVLEESLHAIYRDRGWDLTSGGNRRLGEGESPAAAFPTLTDLVTKAEEVTGTLGYEERVTGDIRAALRTRLNSLRAGGKGAMLDVQRSVPFEELLSRPTVLELEGMGDDDDKAFLMGLLLVRLAEHRRASGPADGLGHVMVIEEAHRLLSNVSRPAAEWQADPRGKAVETFSNLLSEIRAYGQGIVVADQIPVRVAPDIIKNTNLKIAHRVVATDDREALAGAMAMDEHQAKALAMLGVGEAAVFQDGENAPLLVKVPAVKNRADPGPGGGDATVRMRPLQAASSGVAQGRSFDLCTETCQEASPDCSMTRPAAEDRGFQRAFARTVLSATGDPSALSRRWGELAALAQGLRPPGVDGTAFLHCLLMRGAEWLSARRGAQAGWSYADTAKFTRALRLMLAAKLRGETGQEAAEAFSALALELHRRDYDPFPLCGAVCSQQPPVCLYRHAAADLIDQQDFGEAWRAADQADVGTQDKSRYQTWAAAKDAGYVLIEFPENDWPAELAARVSAAARSASLCYAQQMLARSSITTRTAIRVTAKLLRGGRPAGPAPASGSPSPPERSSG